MAVSSSSSSHFVEYGRRYFTFCNRPGWVCSSNVSEPLGQRRPREIGDSGSPSIEISLPFLWKASRPQPTPQYGQIDLATCVPSVLGRKLRVRSDIDSMPLPLAPVLIC